MQVLKMWKKYSLLLLVLWMSSCCTPTQPIETTDTVTISREALTNLMESCARTKNELNECLNRESVHK